MSKAREFKNVTKLQMSVSLTLETSLARNLSSTMIPPLLRGFRLKMCLMKLPGKSCRRMLPEMKSLKLSLVLARTKPQVRMGSPPSSSRYADA